VRFLAGLIAEGKVAAGGAGVGQGGDAPDAEDARSSSASGAGHKGSSGGGRGGSIVGDGYRVAMLHGQRSQVEREAAVRDFRAGKAQVSAESGRGSPPADVIMY
jgi:hypothetical protein